MGVLMEFKVGQIVELVDNSDMAAEKGATAEIVEITRWYIKVKWLTKQKGQMDGCYFPKHFILFLRKGQQLLFNFYKER